MPIENLFPNLTQVGYRVTSTASLVYNCLAWAAKDDQQWWEPVSGPGYYWPSGVSCEYTVEALVQVYGSLGYTLCADSSLEEGFERVALYGKVQGYTHAARQLPHGKWTSKLGHLEDIEHDTLAALEGAEYGSVLHIMKRPRHPPPCSYTARGEE